MSCAAPASFAYAPHLLDSRSLAFSSFSGKFALASGQNSASCGVVVRASALTQPYIHWLFFCASLQGKRFLGCVNRPEAVFARVVQMKRRVDTGGCRGGMNRSSRILDAPLALIQMPDNFTAREMVKKRHANAVRYTGRASIGVKMDDRSNGLLRYWTNQLRV